MLGLMLLTCSLASQAQPAKEDSVKELMNISGAEQMGTMMMNQMIPALKQAIPEASEEFWQDVMVSMDMKDLMNNIIPVYQKNLSEVDIQAILAFYKTPSGQKLLASQPAIMQESMQIGQQWGQRVFQEVMQKHAKLKAEKAN